MNGRIYASSFDPSSIPGGNVPDGISAYSAHFRTKFRP